MMCAASHKAFKTATKGITRKCAHRLYGQPAQLSAFLTMELDASLKVAPTLANRSHRLRQGLSGSPDRPAETSECCLSSFRMVFLASVTTGGLGDISYFSK
jgi:hypothetical protein